MDIKHSDSL